MIIILAILASFIAAAITVPVMVANVMASAAGGPFWFGWIALAGVWCVPAGLWIAAWRRRKS